MKELYHVIEEEPSHEIYANVVGLKLTHLCRTTSSISVPTTCTNSREYISESRNEVQVVSNPLKEIVNENPTDDKVSIYRKRLAELPPLSSSSKISLDQSNKGFRILEKMGWKEIQGGLGSRRQGTMEPIRTTLKRDKRGLGSGKQLPSRVTHTMNSTQQNGQQPLAIDASLLDKARSKKARMLITSELPDEYLAYL
mmetsp:Transcript_13053/g.24523  ORF Transcript_13053/g.24523 Transcript_13053/m.24523 type:complete len:197 (-) Transcript_13053:1081-1671(-)